MDYKGYEIRHLSFHCQKCDIDKNGNPTELVDTIEVANIHAGYSCEFFMGGRVFDNIDKLKQAIDEYNVQQYSETIRNFVESLQALAEDLSEKRSDIADILESIIDHNGLWLDRNINKTEHRFITCQVPKGAWLAQYDTLTTEISFMPEVTSVNDNPWVIGKGHIYE